MIGWRNKFEAEVVKSKGREAKRGGKIEAKWRNEGFCELKTHMFLEAVSKPPLKTMLHKMTQFHLWEQSCKG